MAKITIQWQQPGLLLSGKMILNINDTFVFSKDIENPYDILYFTKINNGGYSIRFKNSNKFITYTNDGIKGTTEEITGFSISKEGETFNIFLQDKGYLYYNDKIRIGNINPKLTIGIVNFCYPNIGVIGYIKLDF